MFKGNVDIEFLNLKEFGVGCVWSELEDGFDFLVV